MAGTPVVYGDITPRTAAYAVKEMLVRALPLLVFEKFGATFVIPNNATKVAKFRRYEALAKATTPLTEGVTPAGKGLTNTDVTATLSQYGDFVTISDVIEDTHEDPVFREAQAIIGEQAAQTIEAIRFGVLKAGTNVFFSTGTERAHVADKISLALQRKVTRAFKRQNAMKLTSIVSSTPNFNTDSISAGFIGVCHVDVSNDIRAMTGFIDVKDYGGSMSAMEGEIGAVDDVRYIESTVVEPWADVGAAASTMVATTDAAVHCDVYPILYFAKNAYGIVPLKGKAALTPIVSNRKPSDSDPLAQRGSVGWKAMTTAVILNQLFMARAEVAALELV